MILPAIASALAIGGASPSTVVQCQPETLPFNDLGLTYWVNPHIDLDSHVCGGLLLLSVDNNIRARIIKLNPDFPALRWMGVGAIVAIHEAFHVGLNSTNEGQVECHAAARVNPFLAQYLSGVDLSQAEAWAQAYDTALPPLYHEC